MHQNSEQSSARETLSGLRARFPKTPFLTLGQTALWDEPTKASLRRMLDAVWPDAELIAAAHDTDYFAKLPGHPPAKEHGKYALVLHDDAKTRGLWSAAGEMSQLFGSEDVATRAQLETNAGVSLHRALTGASDPAFLLSELTAAWGWAGLIYTHWDRKISRDVPLSDIYLALRDQIDWAIDGSVARLEGERADLARKTGAALKGIVETFARTYPEATLTDLYRALFPQLYAQLLDASPVHLSTSCTSDLLRFNRNTATLPRFQFVDLFLNPKTRLTALNAYNIAVAGSDIYTLDQFGADSLPFDLVIPGKGRGTLQVSSDGAVTVGTPQPILLSARGSDVSSVNKLAELIECELGPECVLIGKAISLLPMLSAEYIIVFHEGASGYTDRTQSMMAYLEQKKVALPDLRPILRVKYAAWDALEAVPVIGNGEENAANYFQLPEFLSQAFGQESIRISEFAACWRCAVTREEQRLQELSHLRSTRDLLSYLQHNKIEGDWSARAREYDAANMTLLRLRDQAQAIQGRVYTFYDQIRAEKETALRLEREKGDDFRARVQPLRAQLAQASSPGDAKALQARIDALQDQRATQFDVEIAAHRGQVRYALAYVRDLKEKRLVLERGAASTQARRTLRSIEAEAERAKARLARNALQAVHGLPHTNFRPSAWWFPLVDASGSWFRRLTETAELRLEPLIADR